MRLVFEQAFTTNEIKDNVDLWRRYIDMNRMTGDLESTKKAEQRRNKTFG